jgi:ribosomal protein S18 acetylase RimI-like enzyme
MPDMLVKLYELDDDWQFITGQKNNGITIRKPIGPEKHLVVQWVAHNFGSAWAGETGVAFANRPRSCFVAVKNETIVGFACYDATALGFFGPVGVDRRCRQNGTGTALLMACLLDMKLKGYGYAVVGAVKDIDFYKNTVGAQEIPGSTPGLYRTWIKKAETDS